jgi:hypothetical protein
VLPASEAEKTMRSAPLTPGRRVARPHRTFPRPGHEASVGEPPRPLVTEQAEAPQPKTGRPAAASTVARRMSCLSGLYEYAVVGAGLIEAYIGDRTTGPIFLDRAGRRMTEPSAWRLVRRLARRAKLPAADRLSPHSLRHSVITAALNAGIPFRDVQDFAGHADPRTTRRYDRSRNSLDRHATYALASRLGRGTAEAR